MDNILVMTPVQQRKDERMNANWCHNISCLLASRISTVTRSRSMCPTRKGRIILLWCPIIISNMNVLLLPGER